jgi:hypothetical protein
VLEQQNLVAQLVGCVAERKINGFSRIDHNRPVFSLVWYLIHRGGSAAILNGGLSFANSIR